MDITIPAGETIEEALAAEPISFTVVGHLRTPGKGKAPDKIIEKEYAYECDPDYPFGAFLDFLQSVGSGSGGARLFEFIHACLANDDERTRFTEMLHTPGLRLNPDLLDVLANSLIGAYTNRPTRQPSGSAGGPSRAARRSAAGANGRG